MACGWIMAGGMGRGMGEGLLVWVWGVVGLAVRVLVLAPGVVVWRFGELVWEFERVAVHGLGLVVGAGMCVGAAAWLETHRLLAVHGGEASLPGFLAVAIWVEVGPLLAGVLTAARVGSGLAAELGVMTLNEEIDARTALGVDVVESLVAPRVVACLVAVPLLTVVLDAAALAGGLLAESAGARASPGLYWSRSLTYVRAVDVVPATLKTAVFGLLVGAAACWTGLACERSTEAVGRAAVRGVVRGVILVLAANLLLIPILQALPTAFGWRF